MVSPRVIPKSEVIPVHPANAVTGETPYWDERIGTLWWIDIQGQRLLGFRPGDGATETHNLPSMPGLLVGRRRGGLLVGLEDGIWTFEPGVGLRERLVAVEADDPRTRINDGKPDTAGRLWFGSMDKTGRFQPIGGLWRLDPDGRLERIRSHVRVPNAIDFSPDGRRMYFADSPTGIVEAIDYEPSTGTAGNSRQFMATREPSRPDGCCVDAEGGLWVAIIGAGRVERRLEDGTLDTIVELPVSRPTMPALGGPDGRTLFVTSQRRLLDPAALAAEPLAGDLLAVRVDVTAAPVRAAAI